MADLRDRLTRLGFLADAGPCDLFDDHCRNAVRAFQQHRDLAVDGLAGPATFRALESARWDFGDRILSYSVSHPFHGDDVADLQFRLMQLGFDAGGLDGWFGPRTDAALREFQRNYGVAADGTCGPATLRAFDQLRKTVSGGHPQWVRESTRLLRHGPGLAGRTVAIDPGHGDGTGAVHGGLAEDDIAYDLATRLDGRLGLVGVQAVLTRGRTGNPPLAARAELIREVGADVVISLHVDAARSPAANGVATFYSSVPRIAGRLTPHGPKLGDDTTRDSVGQRLAEICESEISARTGLTGLRSHPARWDLLGVVTAPVVQIECGYLTNPADAARMATAAFRDSVADAIVVSLQRLFLPAGTDADTGRLQLADLAAMLV